MTKTAKLDAPTVSLDRSATVLRPASAHQTSQLGHQPAAPQQIDNTLVAELESALQAVVARGPRPQPAEMEETGTAPPSEAVQSEEIDAEEVHERPAPQGVWYGARDAEASEPSRAHYPLLRPAETREPSWDPSSAAEPAPEARRPAADPARRRGLPLRAALCVTGLVGLAGAGWAGLILAGGEATGPTPVESVSGDTAATLPAESATEQTAAEQPVVAPVARQVRTETIRVPAADMPAMPGNGEVGETGMPGRAATAETPASEVTLLRPVGGSPDGTAGAAGEAQQSATAPTVKTPDRLAEAAAPAPFPAGAEATGGGSPGETVESFASQSSVRTIEPADGTAERLGSQAAPAGSEALVATVPTPLQAEELVARSASEGEEANSTVAPAEAGEEGSAAASGTDVSSQAAAAGDEPTRSAPVTSAVNMRAGPDNDATVLTVVPAGSTVDVVACEQWCEVVFSGERGWIYRSFIGGTDS